MIINTEFKDYILLDAGDGEKLESWNGIILRRPDPMAIWPKTKPELWNKVDAHYNRSNKGGGYWKYNTHLKEYWTVHFNDLTFKVSPTNFKHTGLFPEQASNWAYMQELISKEDRDIKVLNLFAYTGAATMAASYAGAKEVVHVDASRGMVEWAKENMRLCHLEDHTIRFIVDDCLKFIRREIKRGHKYDGIIMDPPSYGRGPNNELFKFEDKINELLEESLKLLSDEPLFFILNSYTTGYSSSVLKNTLRYHTEKMNLKGNIVSDELGIQIKGSDYCLPCGFVTRWSK